LKLGESYLLQVKAGVHKHLVLAKVIETADKKLDVDVAMSQLVKYEGQSSAFVEACKFKFVGAAKPEYADKQKFVSDGEISSTGTCSSYHVLL
jgi:hypothetical protein